MDPEENHSAQNLQASENEKENSRTDETRTQTASTGNTESDVKQRVKWPNAAEKKTWQLFEDEVDKVLEATLAGDVDRKVRAMSTIIYSMGMEGFGVEENNRKTEAKRNNRR